MKFFLSTWFNLVLFGVAAWSRPAAAAAENNNHVRNNNEQQQDERKAFFDPNPIEQDINQDIDHLSIVGGWAESGAGEAMGITSASFFKQAARLLIAEMDCGGGGCPDRRGRNLGDDDSDDRVPLPRSGTLLALENLWGRAMNRIELSELYRVTAWVGTTGQDLDSCDTAERHRKGRGLHHDGPVDWNEAICYLGDYAEHRMDEIKGVDGETAERRLDGGPGPLDVCGPACLGAGGSGGGGNACEPPCDPTCQFCDPAGFCQTVGQCE